MELGKQIAVVTGAASGIGRATARRLADAGAQVVLADINEAGGLAAQEAFRADGLDAEYRPLDLSEGESIDRFASDLNQRADAVHILVNVAGWTQTEPFVDNTPEFWDRVMRINLTGPIRLTQRLLRPMLAARRGRIVNVASDAGRVGSMGETVYSAAKGGLIAFTKGLARETARHGVTANCVCPGPTDTPLWQAVPDKLKDAFVKAIPLRRVGRPEEIAEAIAYFAGPRSDYVTGQVLSVSGGLTMAG